MVSPWLGGISAVPGLALQLSSAMRSCVYWYAPENPMGTWCQYRHISLACGRDPVKQGHVVHSTGDHAWSQAPPDVNTIGEQECIVAVICNSVYIHFHSTMVH